MGTDSATTDGEPELAIADGELIVVSNRQPYSHGYAEDSGDGDSEREIVVDRPAGGLTAGLDPVLQRTDGTWIAWGDGEADREVTDADGTIRMPPETEAYTLKRVWLTEEEVEKYYYGYSNQVLWPLCHGGVWKTDFATRYWEEYRDVNRKFADAVIEQAEDDPLIWFQDYHFALAPRLVRNELEDPFLMQFWHITWPGWDTFRACPQSRDLLEGLLANDLLGFHVERYWENFLDCVANTIDEAFVDRERGRVQHDDHVTRVRAFPMGVDVEAVREGSAAADGAAWTEFRRQHGIPDDARVAVGVDRLDYTKGIPERLNALEHLWEHHPEWRERLTYVQKASESRSLIPDYQDLQQRVNDATSRINERFGTEEWTPVVYIDEFLDYEDLCGIYRHGDVMLVSAVRDGMNLVSKEYVAAQIEADEPGVLVLSNQTGAHEELGEHAVGINPYDTEAFAGAIEEALEMNDAEREERMSAMREQVEARDLYAWMDAVFETATALKHGQPVER